MTRAKLAPAFVSFLGSLGLALAFGYLLLIARAFGPRGGEIVSFLIGTSDEKLSFGFLVFLVPYGLLMAHLWMRIRLGAWLLERGEDEAAKRYASRRTKSGLLRAKKEALAHRTVLVRVALREIDYDEAWRLCDDVPRMRRPDAFLVDFRRWQLEAALRRDNLVAANEITEELGVPKSKSAAAAGFCACAAEIAVREGDQVQCDEWLARAEFSAAEHPRIVVVKTLAAAAFGPVAGGDDAPGRESDSDYEQFLRNVPGAAGELLATRALLASRYDLFDESDELIRRASACENDRRSEFVIDRITAEMRRDPNGEEE